MVRTRVGYSGGTKRDPTYRRLGDHTETVQVDFDPGVVSYEELLDVFWAAHDPTHRSWLTQYKSSIFFMNGEQEAAALAAKKREAKKRGEEIATEIIPFNRFYLAEGYHQKHRLQGEDLFWDEFTAIYPDLKDLVNSTAAARVNGFLSGFGAPGLLKREIDGYGLSGAARKKLLRMAGVQVSSRPGLADACPI